MRRILLSLCIALLPAGALARNYDTSSLPYSDAPQDRATAIAVSVLTAEGIVQGNPDGTFRPDALLNRAEFLKIAMGLLPEDTAEVQYGLTCFPDVFATSWYAPYVCRAKALGIVEGNRNDAVPRDQWVFAPARNVQYVEALKILSVVLDIEIPVVQGEWYAPYVEAAKSLGVHLPENPVPDKLLTRGDMARLVTRFIAQRDGELSVLMAAEQGNVTFDTEEVGDDTIETGTGDTASGDDLVDEGASGGLLIDDVEELTLDEFDPDENTVVHQQFLPLGEVSPVLAGASVFSESQPLDVTSVVIRVTDTDSVDSMIVYDQDTRLLGRAFLDILQQGSFAEFRLPLKRGKLTIPKGEDFSFYVRAVMKSSEKGGVSGEAVQVLRVGLEGNGAWNNKNQSVFSTDTFPVFQTAKAVITEISNPESDRNFLIAGRQLRMGSFRFAGRMAEGADTADLLVTELRFQLNLNGGVTVANVHIGSDGSEDRSSCDVVGSEVTCASLPASIGTFEDRPRILTLYGDISIPSSASSAALQLSLNEPGSVQTAGPIRWTDGTSTFHWVPGDVPVANGTRFEF